MLRYTSGSNESSLMAPFTKEGGDLIHLNLKYNGNIDNYDLTARTLVKGFEQPVDAVLLDNSIYVIEHSFDKPGNIWKITLPSK